ncbi:FkbM family methyltransferase [Parasphingorhabdus pacifica]
MTDPQAHPDPAAEESGAPEGTDPASGPAAPPHPTSEGRTGAFPEPTEPFGEPEWPTEPPEAVQPPSSGGTLLGCTVVGRSRIPAAEVLRESFLHHHPEARFVRLVVDEPENVDQTSGDVLTPVDLGIDRVEFARLAVACTGEQLRALLRPLLLRKLIETGVTALYLEPSVQIFGAFDDLLQDLNEKRPVALVPRVLRPLLADGMRPDPGDLAEAGTFDPSAFAVRPGAEELLASWEEQLRADPTVGTSLDRTSVLVDHHVIRDPGVGLSVWNAAQRDLLTSESGHRIVDGAELRSVHFDGFQPQRPWLLSTYYADRPRVLLSENTVLAGLCAGYRNALVVAGYTREEPDAFDSLPEGTVLPDALRAEYLRLWLRDGDVPPSPFEPVSSAGNPVNGFLDWACSPADPRQAAAGGSRWTAAVWSDDPVLRRDYPDPFGADADAFYEWCVGVGVASTRVPAPAVRERGAGDPAATLVDQLGVAVVGSGRIADLVRAAVRVSGLPSADSAYYPVVLRCEAGVAVPAGRHLIDVRADGHREHSAEANETWVLSEAARRTVRRGGSGPTRVVSLPLLDPGCVELPARKAARARFGFDDEFVIGAFAEHADERQDNVLGLVNAFVTAFAERDDVRLLISVADADEYPEAAERLRLATVIDPRVVLLEDGTDHESLLSVSDCVASLHRADGGDHYALRLLEIAAHGVPVIAADHGAVSELLGAQGAKLVACQGSEPDLDAAAKLLREVADDPRDIAEFGVTAREHLLAEHNVTRAGQRLRERVEHAYRDWRTKWAKDRQGEVDDPLHPLLAARHALHRTPEVGANSRNSMAPALRKAVLRALSHYDDHIRDVMRSLVDGVEQTAAELLRRQYDADGGSELDIDSLRAELTRIGQRQERLEAQLVGTDDGMVRARADLSEQHRRLRELEADGAGTDGAAADGQDSQVPVLAQRLDSLTSAVERTLDRIDALEKSRGDQERDREIEAGVRTASNDAAHAMQRTDVLQRVLLREHERNTGSEDDTSAPVLCDAGLLRLPADDGLMLPWLSSHATWDGEVSALIDSLLEPDGVFVDVGAYVGYQTVRVLSRLGNSGVVVAVEPSARAIELLHRNVEINVPAAWGRQLVTIAGAAWDAECELRTDSGSTGGLRVVPEERGPDDSRAVRGLRLDRELANHAALDGLKLSVIHVDVMGRAHRVLAGLTDLIHRDRPSIVCSFTPEAIEGMGDDPGTVLREFGTWGYDLVPVGRTQAVSADQLMQAIQSAGTSSTVKLWLRPHEEGA